jgi:hypothetical protein
MSTETKVFCEKLFKFSPVLIHPDGRTDCAEHGVSGGGSDHVVTDEAVPGRVAPPQPGVQAVETGTLCCLNRKCNHRKTRPRSASPARGASGLDGDAALPKQKM